MTERGVEERTLVIEGGRIAADDGRAADATVDLAGFAIFPGLVNAHDHLLIDNHPCPDPPAPKPDASDWIEEFQPRFQHPEFAAARAVPARVRAWHGGLKNVLAGTTTVAHHDAWDPAFDEPGFPVRVVKRFGWSHSLRYGPTFGPPPKESHAGTPPDAPWFIHLAEGTDARAAGELGELDRLGLLTPNTVVVHGVGLTDGDVARVIEAGAGVVWCPSSNLKILGRTLDGRRLRSLAAAGRLALGTDARFTGARDLLDELAVAREVSGLSGRELLPLVTTGAARLLRAEAGTLTPGSPADLLIARDAGGDPARRLGALRRADAEAVVVRGRVAFASPELARLAGAAGAAWTDASLDGAPRVVSPAVLGAPEAAALEPGLVLS